MSDQEAAASEAAAAVFVPEESGKSHVFGGPVRGTILHKLMEEVLTGETSDGLAELKARAFELLSQLGVTATEDPKKGISPDELASVILRTLALPDIAALRDRLSPEFSVYGHALVPDDPQTEVALSGIADALALSADGKIEVIVDWKSDVSPTNSVREKYRAQVRDYVTASGAERGLIAYMTPGNVEQVLAEQV